MTSDTAAPRRRSRLFHASSQSLLPRGTQGLPDAVADANERAWILLEQRDELVREMRDARKVAGGAVAELEAATAAAELEDRHAAADNALKDTVFELYDRMREQSGPWIDELVAASARHVTALAASIDEMRARYVELESNRKLIDALRTFDGNPKQGFGWSPASVERLREREDKAKAALLSRGRGQALVHMVDDEVFAALRLLTSEADERPTTPGRASW